MQIESETKGESVRGFIKQNKTAITCALLFSLVCCGYMLTSHTITIDEETWILADSPSILWLLQGRFAIWIFNAIFTTNGNFAPFLWDFLSIVTWNLTGVVFAYSYFGKQKGEESKIPSYLLFFFCAYFASLPFVMGEILSFSFFNLQVTTGMLAVAFAFLFTIQYQEKQKKGKLAVAFVLLVYAFSIYQALICVYVTAVVAYCLLRYVEDKLFAKEMRRGILLCVGAIIIYYVLNSLILHFIGSASYLSENYIGWFGEEGVFYALFMALANVGRVSLGLTIQDVSIYGGTVICAVTVLFIGYSVYTFAMKKGLRGKLMILGLTLALVVAPFSLYIVLGTYKTQGRMLLALPLAGAVELVLLFRILQRNWLRKIAIALVSLLLFFNARNMNEIYYNAEVVYHHDQVIANQVMMDIQRAGYDYHTKPVIFLGNVKLDQIPIRVSSTLGGSMFEWDDGNNVRMRDFMQTEGYHLLPPSKEQMQEALLYKDEMQVWPMQNSIKETENSIIVLFSQPSQKWYKINNLE